MIYVDDMRAGFGRMKMCHMISDSSHWELLRMAEAIGVARKWIQCAGTYKEHFDICQNKRQAAIKLGAIQITQRQLARIVSERRSTVCDVCQSHQALHTAGEVKMCCRCYVLAGNPAATWHPVCMATYNGVDIL